MTRNRLKTIIVMLTSDKKNLLFMISFLLSRVQMTLVIVFFIALRQDLL